MNFWLIQAIGFIGSVLAISVMQVNNRKLVLATQFLCCILWVTHYYLLGAYTAVIINIFSMGRAVVFYNNDKKWAKSRLWFILFIVLFIISPILQWEAYYSIFPALAMVLTTIGLWSHSMKLTRLMFLVNSPFMLAYDILCRSYSCAVIETIALLSFVLAIWRFDIKKPEKGTEDV